MKGFLIFVAIIISAQALNEEQKKKFMEVNDGTVYDKCLEKSDADEDLVMKSLDNKFEYNINLKNFYYCYFKKIGVITKTGDILEGTYNDYLMKVLGFSKEVAELMKNECSVEKDRPAETAFQLLKCVMDLTEGGKIKN